LPAGLEEKPDTTVRPNMRHIDTQGNRSQRTCAAILCDDCLTKVFKPGSRESHWLFDQVSKVL